MVIDGYEHLIELLRGLLLNRTQIFHPSSCDEFKWAPQGLWIF